MKKLFNGIYNNKKVFLTGHTGFKGSWFARWLLKLGADVTGFALDPPTSPSHYTLLNDNFPGIIGDIRDKTKLGAAVHGAKPEIIFHFAAQPIVRFSYSDPVETFETNLMGTLNLYQVCRSCPSVRAIVNVTSDKCYENREWEWAYREIDPMGGFDPYSASKGCSELLTACFRNSFFNIKDYNVKHNVLLSSVRAGNVIGGGDWAEDRLVPDIMRAVNSGTDVIIRNPDAVRPWQHVLEPLAGYLNLGQRLLEGEKLFADAWNFGPDEESSLTVEEVVLNIRENWEKIVYKINKDVEAPHESSLLKLDSSKAREKLRWKNVWGSEMTFKKTVDWYREYYEKQNVITDSQILSYVAAAEKSGLPWAKDYSFIESL